MYCTHAITRKPGKNFAQGLTTSNLGLPDYELISSINYLGNNTLIVTKDFANKEELERYDKIVVDETEAYAANTLWVNDRLLTPKGFPKTKKKLESLELNIIELDMSEVRKMDGGITCWSIRF